MNLYGSLIALERRHTPRDQTWTLKKGWRLELKAPCTLTAIDAPMTLPAQLLKRGNTAKNNPNFFYDTARNALSSDGRFSKFCLDVAGESGNKALRAAVHAYFGEPVFSRPGLHNLPKAAPLGLVIEGKQIKGEDWVVLTYAGTPIGMTLFAQYQRAHEKKQQQGQTGVCIFTGDRGPLARLHPPVTFGAKGGSSTNLMSCNEGANEYFGQKQGENFPMTVGNAAAYTSAMNRAFEESAFLTETEAIAIWPDEGTQHPIIPLIREVATRYVKLDERALVDKLWTQIEAVPDLDAKLHLAALVHKMSRVSVRGYRVRTARDLRDNLLAFRDCFADLKFPTTFRWLLPHTTRRGVPSISNVCLLDTAWAVLMGDDYPPQLRTTMRARYTQARQRVDWQTDDTDLSYCLRWFEILDNRKDSTMTAPLNTEISERARAWIEEAHEETRRELEQRMLLANSLLRSQWMHHRAYNWGRFLAVCCSIKSYYHIVFGDGKRLPRPRDEALKRGLAQPQTFVASYRPQRYLEQIRRRVNSRNPLMNTYAGLFVELSDPPSTTSLTPKERNLATYGFCHQFDGLDKARAYKSDDTSLDLDDPQTSTD